MLITDDFLRFLDAVIETTARRLKAFIGEPFIETPVFSQSVAVIAWAAVFVRSTHFGGATHRHFGSWRACQCDPNHRTSSSVW